MNNELTAALLTIEKCRELSGCPAGVDLQDWVKQLAAERDAALNAERVWETAMMEVCGEDGPASVANEIRSLRDLRDTAIQALKSQVEQLAAENVRLAAENKMAVDAVTVFSNVTHDVTEIICDELGHDRVAEIVAAYNDLGNMPATDRIVAGIKADGRVEGAHFVANRMLAAWDAGFIEDSAKNAADIARMILTSTEFMADAPEGDFDRSFADGILEDIAKQLREGADK